jgi:hypothetical protein
MLQASPGFFTQNVVLDAGAWYPVAVIEVEAALARVSCTAPWKIVGDGYNSSVICKVMTNLVMSGTTY